MTPPRLETRETFDPPPLGADATCVALIPARAGSKRVPGKNVRLLAGHPTLAYSISAALDAGVFVDVVVSTEDDGVAELARRYGAEVLPRPPELAADRSPDIDWIRHLLETQASVGRRWDCFSILRPTSPFRRPETIVRAWRAFLADGRAESLRAVQLCREHPAKMWRVEPDGTRMRPIMRNPDPDATPWHSTPYQALPVIHVQNASLEIGRTSTVLEYGTIAGEHILPFLTEGLEGFDINGPDDWILAERHAAQQPSPLPTVRRPA